MPGHCNYDRLRHAATHWQVEYRWSAQPSWSARQSWFPVEFECVLCCAALCCAVLRCAALCCAPHAVPVAQLAFEGKK